MHKLGVNRDNQKKTNRGLVLKLIATQQCNSRVDLSRTTGLTKTAISQIVTELINQGYLVETQKENTQELGRNPVGLGISPEAPKYAGVLIERRCCEAVICDMQLNMIDEKRIDREWTSAEELMESVYSMLDSMLPGQNVAGIGVASIGPVSVKEGVIVRPLYFHDIRDIHIRSILEDRYHLPVVFDHDNQSAALAEQMYGAGRGYQDILLVGVTEGVGCGILVNGQRVHSYNGYAPEIGHVSVDSNGENCICGNSGCLEMYLNSIHMMRLFKEVTGKELSYAEYCNMTDNEQIDRLMKDAIAKLDAALISTMNILNSQIIILSEDCCFWPDKYIQMMQQEINQKKFGNRETLVPVLKAHFLLRAQVLGAACNVINQVFHGELL